jgi:hypothetical protein
MRNEDMEKEGKGGERMERFGGDLAGGLGDEVSVEIFQSEGSDVMMSHS